ncbi:MauE/DoxX family redox-associated membrane protein [Christiangramia flava]|uniref:MauE/DoxX family redox-associated membrane protein n=1 Tax=Christiangramia flava TaxID=1486245 RepID=UPI0009FAE516|nr:MauE/DoxX family redox-associated membrane protein [Christiangramia flava]
MIGWKEFIREFTRYAFIVLFLYAALFKLIDYQTFYDRLLNSPVIRGEIQAQLISVLLPVLELTTAGLLISKSYRKTGIYLAFILMLLFTIYIAGILLFSQEIPCSCGGIINDLTWNEHLIFNIGFLLLGAMGMYLESNRHKAF